MTDRDKPKEILMAEIPTAPNTLSNDTRTYKINWTNAIGIGFYHVIALLCFLPYFFSWSGVLFGVVTMLVFNTLGINILYHRFLTHKGFRCHKWAEYFMAVLAVCCFQDTPARWVAVHRRHHEHSDDDYDPHSPIRSFLWAHVGWIIMDSSDLSRYEIYGRYAKDILRDPFYRRLEKQQNYLGIIFGHWLVFFILGAVYGLLTIGTAAAATQLGFASLLWGVFFRTIIGWHITWAVNSVTHIWGYRNYETDENSRNNVIVGILASGEGWHNNHHADPRSARHGHKWWELDMTYLTIRAMGLLGIAWQIAEPRQTNTGDIVKTRAD